MTSIHRCAFSAGVPVEPHQVSDHRGNYVLFNIQHWFSRFKCFSDVVFLSVYVCSRQGTRTVTEAE